jgi:hypothetical protein
MMKPRTPSTQQEQQQVGQEAPQHASSSTGRAKRSMKILILLVAIVLVGLESTQVTKDMKLYLPYPQPPIAATTSSLTTATGTKRCDSEPRSTSFDKAAVLAFKDITKEKEAKIAQDNRQDFVLSTWDKRTKGGLLDEDRQMVANIYRQADSVFEYGLGESTYIADHVGVPKYAGIDSDAVWVDQARAKVSPHFRFYYGDIGTTGAWGKPENPRLAKNAWQYQVAPLQAEPEPFDVYMVDGRYRVSLVMLCLLHASARGADPEHTIILMHDCERISYQKNDDILDLVNKSGAKLCVYKRKNTTTDEMLLERYGRSMYEYN